MKKNFSQSWIAVLLCVAVMLGTTVLNTRVKLGRESRRVSELLYSDRGTVAGGVLSTLRSGLNVLSSVNAIDKDEIDDAMEELENAIKLLDGSASIGTQLGAYCEGLDVPIALAKLHGVDSSKAEAAVSALNAALAAHTDAETLQNRYNAVLQAADELFAALASADLKESQRERLTEYSELLQGLRREIASSSYNEQVYSFLRKRGGAFTTALASIAGVEYPRLFG